MKTLPLAERLRPKQLDELVGQEHLIGPHGFLSHVIAQGRPFSLLLWGPPGCGKTTLARLYAHSFSARFFSMSAVSSGIAEIKKLIQQIESEPLFSPFTLLFLDEIHRFNKAQQDLFLPYLENGTIILVGATTENPSFALNNALLSRLRVLTLNPLSESDLLTLVERSLLHFPSLSFTPEAKKLLAQWAQGDARHLLNSIENLLSIENHGAEVTVENIQHFLQKRSAVYDRAGDGHYNLISALHKSLRGSDPDASLYWFARMLEGGEDPHFIARRLVRMATEDIGLADPQALSVAIAAWEAYDRLGKPEGELALAEAVLYLALAPKSNATYTALKKAQAIAKETSHLSPPKTILNAPTEMMKEMGYGKGYLYDHDLPLSFSGQEYFPEEMAREKLYMPREYGFEREMKKRADYFSDLRKKTFPRDSRSDHHQDSAREG